MASNGNWLPNFFALVLFDNIHLVFRGKSLKRQVFWGKSQKNF
jgi:hypothetical protein